MKNPSVDGAAAAHPSGADILSPDVMMMVLTWVTFFILLAILKKFAFKPILETLEKRERDIRESLDNADKAKRQLQEIEADKQRILDEARQQAIMIVDDARKVAKNLAADIEVKGRQHAQDIIKGAQEEIEADRQRLLKGLRQESGELAISLAGKIIKENMDQEKNRRLVKEAVEQL